MVDARNTDGIRYRKKKVPEILHPPPGCMHKVFGAKQKRPVNQVDHHHHSRLAYNIATGHPLNASRLPVCPSITKLKKVE